MAALDRRTRPLIVPKFLAKVAASEALGSLKQVYPSYKQVYRMGPKYPKGASWQLPV